MKNVKGYGTTTYATNVNGDLYSKINDNTWDHSFRNQTHVLRSAEELDLVVDTLCFQKKN